MMRIRVKGDRVPENVVRLYVGELVKAHPEKNINEVDIIVDGDYMKVVFTHDELGKTA